MVKGDEEFKIFWLFLYIKKKGAKVADILVAIV